ncbi:MAG TPA: N-6 DNA methylase, partial [Acidobacteriaceae bacterium]|nr:N-6 DNA methylase [Acidobacteriaceae bacterium]
IGRFIYFFVLLDRGIVTASWVQSLKDSHGRPLCKVIAKSLLEPDRIDLADQPWPAREIWALFRRIDCILNGTIFPITEGERRHVPTGALHLVRRAIRHGDLLRQGTRQLGFLDVSFATLRTETISAIYELFLLIESPDEKNEDGAFYTPPFLVDYVLDEVDRIRPFTASSRTLDPAAGSGIFLVGAYRRILERTMPTGCTKREDFKKARALLENSIFGIERNKQAANVARFSLYLTLLDYFETTEINMLGKLIGYEERVFPRLTRNVLSLDVFTINSKPGKEIGRFTHVVGNPPWGSLTERSDRTNVWRGTLVSRQRRANLDPALSFYNALDRSNFPVTNKRLSELFVWKIQRDLIDSAGVLGVLISTRSYVARTATAFPTALARHMKICGLANLCHFRYRLFKDARNPTLAIFAEARKPQELDPIWIYSPLLTSQPIGERGHLWSIIVSELDIDHYRLRDLTRASSSWFWALMLRPIDRRFASYLSVWASRFNSRLGDFLRRYRLVIARGGSPAQTGLPSSLLLGTTDYRERLGLDGLGFGRYPHDRIASSTPNAPFKKMFSGNIVLIPRHMNDITLVERPVAFGSSFNALYFSDDSLAGKQNVAILSDIARFLDSHVARYLYALFGKTRLLDRARLEKNDLAEIPFPFAEVGDSHFSLARLDEDQLTQSFAKKVGLDETFVSAVQEYAKFRHGYEDAQIPPAGFNPPYPESVMRYRSMLVSQLSQRFGPDARIDHHLREPTDSERFAYIDIGITRMGTDIRPAGEETSGLYQNDTSNAVFSPHSDIAFDPRLSRAFVSKPWTRVAWTVEQAFADAYSISEEVLRSGIAA